MTKRETAQALKWMNTVITYKSLRCLNDVVKDLNVYDDRTHVSGIEVLAEACGQPITLVPFNTPDDEEHLKQGSFTYNNHVFFELLDEQECRELHDNKNIVVKEKER